MSWSSWKKKEGIFYHLFCPIFNIYVLFQCIVYTYFYLSKNVTW